MPADAFKGHRRHAPLYVLVLGVGVIVGVLLAVPVLGERSIESTHLMGGAVGAVVVLFASLVLRGWSGEQASAAFSDDLLRDAGHMAPLGWWHLDLRSGAMQWSHPLYRMMDLSPGQLKPSLYAALRFVHPSDRRALLDIVRQVIEEGGEEDTCLRLRQPSGGLRIVRVHLRVHRDLLQRSSYLSGLCLDLTESMNQMQGLVTAMEEVSAADRVKRALLDNMSHEIRTPLTSILGFADVLIEEADDEEQMYLRHIKESGQRLLTTMTSLLSLAYLEDTSSPMLVGRANVSRVLQERVDRYRKLAEQREITLQVFVPEDQIEVPLEPEYMAQMLDHLTNNALKFTKQGMVTIAVEVHDETVQVEVADTGIGIGDSFQSHLFEPFQQESTGWTREFDGAGLGLTVVKRIVDSVEGRITVKSGKEKGSTFTITLPRCREPENIALAADEVAAIP